MFSKLKYILFDFSDNFKNDYLSLTKKTIIFLVAGIIMFSFKNSNNTVYTIGCFAIIIFGFLWGINLANSLFSFTNISSNVMIRMRLQKLLVLMSFIFGYIYFIWSTIKFIIFLIKKQAKK